MAHSTVGASSTAVLILCQLELSGVTTSMRSPLFFPSDSYCRRSYYYESYQAMRDATAPHLPLYLEEFASQAGGERDSDN